MTIGQGGAQNDAPFGPEIPPPIDECPHDPCPYESGVTFRCRSRFVYGVNWAWNHFAGDFGGISAWGVTGVSQSSTSYSTNLADMKAHGANVIRWWMFPDFRGDGVRFDDEGTPIGLGDTVLDDVSRALELAQLHDVYLMLTLFSFDGFRTHDTSPSMTEIVLSRDKRTALIDTVVRPLAEFTSQHEHAIRLHSWDLINEPEWAMIGESLHGDPDYLQSDTGTDPISHGDMDEFLEEVLTALRAESSALVSVGTTIKWPHAWDNLDLDFHQLHYYPWVEPLYPLDVTPADLGLDDKPVVLGEFPLADEYTEGLEYTYEEIMDLLMENGWAGAIGWDWSEATLQNKDQVEGFASENACITTY